MTLSGASWGGWITTNSSLMLVPPTSPNKQQTGLNYLLVGVIGYWC